MATFIVQVDSDKNPQCMLKLDGESCKRYTHIYPHIHKYIYIWQEVLRTHYFDISAPKMHSLNLITRKDKTTPNGGTFYKVIDLYSPKVSRS